ncbi:hypothetical protein OC834_007397 [Tilletia horrida]|uniref:CBM1 domain-containing protein n=1 Tax=Tilletia horrida TaxID=155126 RepID=A0AAN6G2K0_9BASI|nr:hypothetical protein OC842_008039 [Tilletia horrida]KAK0519385.1 hypothetical protein OC834_007397 [Tilletia horrida]
MNTKLPIFLSLLAMLSTTAMAEYKCGQVCWDDPNGRACYCCEQPWDAWCNF